MKDQLPVIQPSAAGSLNDSLPLVLQNIHFCSCFFSRFGKTLLRIALEFAVSFQKMTPQKTIEKITPNCKVFVLGGCFKIIPEPLGKSNLISIFFERVKKHQTSCAFGTAKPTTNPRHTLLPSKRHSKLKIRIPIMEDRLFSVLRTVDGRNPANQLIGSLSNCLQGFIHPRWCRISSINSMLVSWNMFTYTSRICFENQFFLQMKPWIGWFLVLLSSDPYWEHARGANYNNIH